MTATAQPVARDAGNAHTIAIPKGLFAVARRALAVVQIGAWPVIPPQDGEGRQGPSARGHKKTPTTDVEAKLQIKLVLTLQSSPAKS